MSPISPQWRSKEGASGGTRPGARLLVAYQHTFCSHLKRVLSRNLNQSMLENAYLLEEKKNCKNRLGVGGSSPEPPFAFSGWRLFSQTPALLLRLLLQLCRVYF